MSLSPQRHAALAADEGLRWRPATEGIDHQLWGSALPKAVLIAGHDAGQGYSPSISVPPEPDTGASASDAESHTR